MAHTLGYEVTRDGRVFSCASNWRGYGRRELQQTPNDDGYPSVRLTIDGKRTRYGVHVLVAREYLGPRPAGQEVRHLDGNKLNASVENLAWGTPQDNAADRERHGRTSRGPAHSAAIRASNHADAVRAASVRRKTRGALVAAATGASL